LSKTKNIPPKAVIFSDFICTFAMSLMILLVLICSTKVLRNLGFYFSFASSTLEVIAVCDRSGVIATLEVIA